MRTPGPAALVTGQRQLTASAARTIKVAGGGGREDALHVQLANGTALRPIASAQWQKNRNALAPAGTVRKPDRREGEVGQQRDAQVNVVRGDQMTPLFCSPEILVAI